MGANFFTKSIFFIARLFHHPLPFGGRIHNEDCSAVSACVERSGRVGTVFEGDWYIERNFGSAAFVLGSLLAGIYVSKFGLKKTLFTLCHLQSSVCDLYFPCGGAAYRCVSDRNVHYDGVFWLWLRVCLD